MPLPRGPSPTRTYPPVLTSSSAATRNPTGLHTDFRLESGKGGALYLFRGGKAVDALTAIPKQPAPGVAYARFDTPAVHWAHAVSPTPKTSNGTVPSQGVLSDPVFSVEGGVYRAQQILTLSLPVDAPAGTVIRYTRDGSEPTATSAVYGQPLAVVGTCMIRAKLFCDGWASPRSVTHTYIFPDHNVTLPIVFWRPRAEGGRWRIIVKDTDYSLGIYDEKNTFNIIEWINNADYDPNHNWANTWEHTRLFRRLMEDMGFRRTFLERCAIYMGDFMNERGTRATWDAMYALIKDEYPHHRALINKWWPNYSEELSKARKWLSGRTAIHYEHLANYYKTGTPTALVINAPLPFATLQGLRVSFNGVELSEGTFNGRFYEGSEIHLRSRPATDDDVAAYRRMQLCAEGALPAAFNEDVVPQQVVGWRVTTIGTNGTQTLHEYATPDLDLTMPACACLQIVAITEAASAIGQIAAGEPCVDSLTTYDLQGRASTTARPAGIYLQSDGHGHHRKVVIR